MRARQKRIRPQLDLGGAAEADSSLAVPSGEIERALIERTLAGKKEVFYQLVRSYERRVYVMAFAISRNEADAQDAVQDSLFKAFTNFSQFRSRITSTRFTRRMWQQRRSPKAT